MFFATILLCLWLSEPYVARASLLTLRADDDSLIALVQQQAQLITQLQARLAALEAWKVQRSQEVAFNAYLNPDVTLNHAQVVKFNHVDLNLGQGYNPASGVFTAPVAGVYEFSFKVTSVAPHGIHAVMVLEGNVKAEVRADGTTADRSSANVIMHVQQGQRVWVRSDRAGTSTFSGSVAHQSTFMGVLVQAD